MRWPGFVGALVLSVVAGCGGGAADHSSGTGSTPTPPSSATNPTPTVTSIAPSSLVAGSSGQSITITGTGFIVSSVVSLNGTALPTTYVSATSLTASVPALAIAADGTAKITVANPAPGGGASGAQNFGITVPTAAVQSLSPQVVPQGAPAVITITGSGFEANSVVQWNGLPRTTTFVNSTTLQVALTAADVQNFGAGQISIANPGLAPTTPLELAIAANTPTITYVSPSTVIAYTGSSVPQQISISGSGFSPKATVQVNGKPVSVLSQSITNISLSLSASYFATPGTITIVVSNPGTPVVSSNPGVITVTGPTTPILNVSPNAVPAGSPDTTITVTGGAFTRTVRSHGTVHLSAQLTSAPIS